LDTPLPAAVDALDMLRAARVAIVLLTARTRPGAVNRQLRGLGILERVDALLVVDPTSAVSEKAAELRRVRACALIGDTESDAAAAAEAGVPFLAVGSGQRSPTFLLARDAGPVHADVGAAAAVLVARLQASATT
jgi:phosphoglycolate phosphatase-like HAD superfamily hydrolase